MTSNSVQATGISLEKIDEYLRLTGWRQEVSNQRWRVYSATKEVHREDVELVLAADTQASDYLNYLLQAIDLLSALSQEDPERIERRINFVDTDVLSVRNVETGGYDSIPLELASRQILQLKQLIRFAASSEKEPRPYFNQELRIGDSMVEHYRFGQTFRGSYGYTLQSPLHHRLQHLRSERFSDQLSFFDDDADALQDIVLPPLERRVMERVVRGLDYTRIASQERSPDVLIREYGSGLNGNMCWALVRAAYTNERIMEYSVLWSPRIKPSDDIIHTNLVTLNETSYNVLAAAAEELKAIEPEFRRIRGLVTNLGAEADPLSESTATREVAIKWINRPDNARPVKVLVRLERDDYILAHRAHLSWSTVEVTGVVVRAGTTWRLIRPMDFSVENLPPESHIQPPLV